MKFRSLMISVVFACLAQHAFANSNLEQPTGDVILTVSGNISNTNRDESAVFDLEMLASLPETVVETETIWTDGVQVFVGVALNDLLLAVGAEGTLLEMLALNDYMIEIPVTDAVENGPIVAYLRNGSPMSVREKGPLWIIYPFDEHDEYSSEVYYARSIWQLDRIIVKE